MKHFLTAAAAVCLSLIPAQAQLTAAKAFVNAPQSVFPLLDQSTRMDMIDYINAGMANQSRNNLGGGSAIINLAPQTLTVKMTDASTSEIFLLPAAGSDTIIGVIRTVATPEKDSSIAFYTSAWKPLRQSPLQIPVLADWMTDRSHTADVEMMVPFMLVGYTFDPASQTLTATNNLKGFLSDDIYSTIAPYMSETISYVWDGKRFNRSSK